MYNNYSAVVSYTYDAWGNPLTITDTLDNTIGTLNPLRYRGYVYDTETGFYYLQSRYYDPTTGRFINMDDRIADVGGEVLGYNTFVYCMNNPVMGYDPTGHWDWGWKDWMAVGVTVVAVGLAILLAAPTGGASLAAGGLMLSSTTVLAAGSALTITGTVIIRDALNQATATYAKQSKKSGKEKANDHPSWLSKNDIDLNKSAHENAKELLNNKYGSGNWTKRSKSEYNQIVKWIDRGLKALILYAVDMLEEE